MRIAMLDFTRIVFAPRTFSEKRELSRRAAAGMIPDSKSALKVHCTGNLPQTHARRRQ